MKVKELINEIQKINPELEAVFYSESEEIAPKDSSFRIIDPTNFFEKEARLYRTDDGNPSVVFGHEPQLSMHYAFIEMTDDV